VEFFVGAARDEFKFHFVEWNTVCTSIKFGGLGVRKLGTLNQTLLGK
jgi:hypothetical protein